MTITADTPASIDTLTGVIALTGKQSEGQTLTLTYSGGLSKSVKSKGAGGAFGPFADDNNEKTKTGGSESVAYKVQNKTGKLVTILKTYTLNSPSDAKDDPAFRIEGTGTWVFNSELGISESMDYKSQLVVDVENAEVRIPLTVSWKRMPEEEYNAYVKERQEKFAAMQHEAKERSDKANAAAKEREGKALPA